MIDIPGLLLFSLILMRMSGFVLLNPIFGRKTVPNTIKFGFILVLTVNLFTYRLSAVGAGVSIVNSVDYALLLLKEFFMGYFLGLVMQLFFYIATFAGAFIDFNMGMSMASVFDPGSNTSIPISGTLFDIMMTMLFFVMDGHLALIKILATADQVVPYGQIFFTPQAITSVLSIFQECTLLVTKLVFPFFALQLLTEMGVGILMKMVPQINFLIINIQIKITVGYFLMLLLCIPVGRFLNDRVNDMMDTLQRVIQMI